EEVADRVAPVAAEVAVADLHSGRSLAALILGAQQLRFDVGDERLVLTGRVGYLRHGQFLIDQPFEDTVERGIWRKAVLVLLAGTKLGGRRLGDHPLGHYRPVGTQRPFRLVRVPPA